jgi:hypothetical protein
MPGGGGNSSCAKNSVAQLDAVLGRFARPGFIAKPSDTSLCKASTPLPNRIRPHTDLTGDLIVVLAAQTGKHECALARPCGLRRFDFATAAQAQP